MDIGAGRPQLTIPSETKERQMEKEGRDDSAHGSETAP